jgi:hypothetical protein
MDLGALLVILSVLMLVTIFVSRPFFMPGAADETRSSGKMEEERKRSELLAEYDRTLAALQELDFDFSMGKIPAEEYPAQRAELLTAGAAALSRLDEFRSSVPAQSVEARLEAAIAARRADTARVPVGQPGQPGGVLTAGREDPLEEMIASRRQNQAEKPGGFCPRCGRPVQKSDRYCPRCGAKLTNSG